MCHFVLFYYIKKLNDLLYENYKSDKRNQSGNMSTQLMHSKWDKILKANIIYCKMHYILLFYKLI